MNSNPSKNESLLLRKTFDLIGEANISWVNVENYTKHEVCELIVKFINDAGVESKQNEEFQTKLKTLVTELNLNSVHDAINFSKEIIDLADYTNRVPVVDQSALEKLMKKRYERGGL